MKPCLVLGLYRGCDRVLEGLLRHEDFEFVTLLTDTERVLDRLGVAYRPLRGFLSERQVECVTREAEARGQVLASALDSDTYRAAYSDMGDDKWGALCAST